MRASGAPQTTRQVKLLRQRKNIDGVVAAGHVGLGCQAELSSSDRASAGGDGDVLPAIDRIRDGAANSLRRKTRLPNDLARLGTGTMEGSPAPSASISGRFNFG